MNLVKRESSVLRQTQDFRMQNVEGKKRKGNKEFKRGKL